LVGALYVHPLEPDYHGIEAMARFEASEQFPSFLRILAQENNIHAL
jgi:hypothetical protein